MYSLKLGAEVIQMSVVKGVEYRVCKYSINPPEQTLRLDKVMGDDVCRRATAKDN